MEALHPLHYKNIFDIVNQNKKSFEKNFLDGYEVYNMANHGNESMMLFMVYVQWPKTDIGQVQYKVTYEQIQFWIDNSVLIDFMNEKSATNG